MKDGYRIMKCSKMLKMCVSVCQEKTRECRSREHDMQAHLTPLDVYFGHVLLLKAKHSYMMTLSSLPILPLNWMKLIQSSRAAWSQPFRLPCTDRCSSPNNTCSEDFTLHQQPAC